MFDRHIKRMLLIIIAITVLLAIAFRFIQYGIDGQITWKSQDSLVEEDDKGRIIISGSVHIPEDVPAGDYRIFHGDKVYGIFIIKDKNGRTRCIYGVNDFFDDFEDGQEVRLSDGDRVIITGRKLDIVLEPDGR